MKHVIKSIVAGLFILHAGVVSAALDTGRGNVDSGLKGSEAAADSAIQVIIQNAMRFLYLIAVIYALWGGFNILTAGGDEEKVKKGKTVLIQACLGLIVIYLASSLIELVVGSLLGTS